MYFFYNHIYHSKNISNFFIYQNSISKVVSGIEHKIESKLEAQSNKLESDIAKLCYETMDLLLASLPQPEFAADYRSSEPLMQSIHKYINADLLQNDLEEGESA